MKLAVVDCETTGKELDAELLELAVVVIEWNDSHYVFRKTGATLVDIQGNIPPEASAVHHITKRMLKDAIPRAHAKEWIMEKVQGCEGIVAHFAEFDRRFLPELSHLPWLCTMTVAKHIWPDAPTYGLQVLRYWQCLPADDARSNPHRAIYDAMCTAHLLARQVEALETGKHAPLTKPLEATDTVGKLKELTDRIPLLRKITFGKYRDKAYADVVHKDRRYFNDFVLLKSDLANDPEIAHTVRYYLQG